MHRDFKNSSPTIFFSFISKRRCFIHFSRGKKEKMRKEKKRKARWRAKTLKKKAIRGKFPQTRFRGHFIGSMPPVNALIKLSMSSEATAEKLVASAYATQQHMHASAKQMQFMQILCQLQQEQCTLQEQQAR